MTAEAPSSRRRQVICGLSGPCLTEVEAAYLGDVRPCGIILFSRNFENNEQLERLVAAAKRAVSDADLLVLIDQEGGRVQRLKGTDWPDLPPARAYGELAITDPAACLPAAELVSLWLSARLRRVGITANCMPCLDVPVPGADGIIGDRAFGADPDIVADIGRAVVRGMLAGGVLPVMKHIPGHGKAGVDSHLALPVVTDSLAALAQDFAPFKALNDTPAAMTAHVVYSAIDADLPASISPTVTSEVIRGAIGFQGFLMSDDISMKALSGPLGARAAAVIESGSDAVLHCNGVLHEMREVADAVGDLDGRSLERFNRCVEVVQRAPTAVDDDAVMEMLASLQPAST